MTIVLYLNKLIKKIKYFLSRRVITYKPKYRTNKRVLISYVIEKYNDDKITFHSNVWECNQIIELFISNGFIVDVIKWDDHYFIPRKKYNYFIDIHNNLERIYKYLNKDCIKILYITGSNWVFQNVAEYNKIIEIMIKKKTVIYPRRIVEPSRGIELCDYAIMLGNKNTKKTFNYINKKIFLLNTTSNKEFDFTKNKEISKIKKNYLWMGGSGFLLKGLDVLLDFFSNNTEYNLFIFGNKYNEEDFQKIYKYELFNCNNIVYLGWVNIKEKIFKEVCDKCIAIIYPSSSEGQVVSVVNCMHTGLIPIISKESGIDISDFGILLKKNNYENVKSAVKKIDSMNDEDLYNKSYKSWEFARKNYSRKKYKENLRFIFKSIKEYDFE